MFGKLACFDFLFRLNEIVGVQRAKFDIGLSRRKSFLEDFVGRVKVLALDIDQAKTSFGCQMKDVRLSAKLKANLFD